MSWLKGALLAAFTAVFVALGLGFLSFAGAVRDAAPPDPLPPADAIVALTGGSQARLETGVRLLEEGHAPRLLISGVNRDVTDEELFTLLDVDGGVRGAIDLGRAAEDTLGNASETAAWARRHNIESLILVTDDYHMPRSFAELQLALPDVELIAYPVPTRFARGEAWRSDLSAATRLGAEYMKYLMIRIRESLVKSDPALRRAKDIPAEQAAR